MKVGRHACAASIAGRCHRREPFARRQPSVVATGREWMNRIAADRDLGAAWLCGARHRLSGASAGSRCRAARRCRPARRSRRSSRLPRGAAAAGARSRSACSATACTRSTPALPTSTATGADAKAWSSAARRVGSGLAYWVLAFIARKAMFDKGSSNADAGQAGGSGGAAAGRRATGVGCDRRRRCC